MRRLLLAIQCLLLCPIILSAEPKKEAIVFGQAISLSGPYAKGVSLTSLPVYDMWIKEVDGKGGIYVKAYGRRLPLRLLRYDDRSDVNLMKGLLKKLMEEDRVDFILPPWSTGFLYEAGLIANRHGYILIGGAGGAPIISEAMKNLPFLFQVLNFSVTQMPCLAAILKELQIRTVAILHHDALHGLEYRNVALKEFEKKGIEVKGVKAFGLERKDFSDLIQDVSKLDVDGLICFNYADETIQITKQMMALRYSPKALFFTVFPNFTAFRDLFGEKTVEGIMGGGGWNAKTPGGKEFAALYRRHYGREPDDWWGQIYYYASLQHLERAIEEAGRLDQRIIRDLLTRRVYETIIGPFRYDPDRHFRGHFGQIGQWQKGVYEIVDPTESRTAVPIIKPLWP